MFQARRRASVGAKAAVVLVGGGAVTEDFACDQA